MDKLHKKHVHKTKSGGTVSQFIESKNLPADIQISSFINFVHFGSEVILTPDDGTSWGPVSGEIKGQVDWRKELVRETGEKAGVLVDGVVLCGYISNESKVGDSDSVTTISPICYSYCHDINPTWTPKGIMTRELFSHSNVKEHLAKRNDEGQMLELYLYIHDQFNRDLRIEFSFLPDEMPDVIFVTSAMVFCIDDDNRICLVKDGDEDFYSLPGGGRRLLESPLECAKRELQEEAQITAKNFKIFGSIIVSFYSNDVLISKMQQARYICDVDVMGEFIPFKDGFETDERIFVQADQLLTLGKQFKNNNGIQIVEHLIKIQLDREHNA